MVERVESAEAASLQKRYKDAYLVARFTVTAGKFVKIIGILVALFVATGGFIVGIVVWYYMANLPMGLGGEFGRTSSDVGFLGFLAACFWTAQGLVWGAFSGGLLYVLGIILAALGQSLKANLDCAVNNSPFLANQQRAQIMSLV